MLVSGAPLDLEADGVLRQSASSKLTGQDEPS